MARRVPRARDRSKLDIERVTRDLIRMYQPAALHKPLAFDIERFFDCDLEVLTGVRPDYRELPQGIHGFTDMEEMVSVISSTLADDKSARRFYRSTIGHEVAHAVLHVDDFRKVKEVRIASKLINIDVGIKLYREEEIPVYCNPEWQAWIFCKSLLMPASVVRKAFRSGYTIRCLSDAFDVHPAFVRSRLRDLRLLPNIGGYSETVKAF